MTVSASGSSLPTGARRAHRSAPPFVPVSSTPPATPSTDTARTPIRIERGSGPPVANRLPIKNAINDPPTAPAGPARRAVKADPTVALRAE